MKKTIAITLSRGSLVRNILKTECFSMLLDAGHRVVIIAPENADKQNICQDEQVIWETLQEAPWTKIDVMLNGLYKSIGYNRHTQSNDLYGIFDYDKEASKIKYWVRKVMFKGISRIAWIKKILRSIDAIISYSGKYKELFDRYKPDILFSTSIVGDTDIEVIKEARKRKIPIVGMPKSWDNLPKICMRVAPDYMFVWGERSKREAMAFSGIDEQKIKIVGASQFDHYYKKEERVSRDEFCKQWGLDPHKKIILFGSEGKVMQHDGDIAHMIVDAINKGDIANAQLVVRPHFIYKGDSDKFIDIEKKGAVLDKEWNPDKAFRDNWDYSDKQIQRFSNLMYHADIMVTSVSTLTVDACVNRMPVVNYYFDGERTNTKHEHSMRRWYEREHYYHIIQGRAASIAFDPQQLIQLINMYLENPEIRFKERMNCATQVADAMDGKAGQRMGKIILELINSKPGYTKNEVHDNV